MLKKTLFVFRSADEIVAVRLEIRCDTFSLIIEKAQAGKQSLSVCAEVSFGTRLRIWHCGMRTENNGGVDDAKCAFRLFC